MSDRGHNAVGIEAEMEEDEVAMEEIETSVAAAVEACAVDAGTIAERTITTHRVRWDITIAAITTTFNHTHHNPC